jgi:hypothetical protein
MYVKVEVHKWLQRIKEGFGATTEGDREVEDQVTDPVRVGSGVQHSGCRGAAHGAQRGGIGAQRTNDCLQVSYLRLRGKVEPVTL